MHYFQLGFRPHRLIALGGTSTTWLHLSLALVAWTMGADYLVADHFGLAPETISEQMAPLWAWGVASIVAASLLTIGALNPPRLRVLQVGHVMMGAIYMMLGVGELIQATAQETPGGWTEGASFLFLGVTIHMILAKAVDAAIAAHHLKG